MVIFTFPQKPEPLAVSYIYFQFYGRRACSCLFLHRDAHAAAARQTAGALAEKMWWYNRDSFGKRVKEAEARAAGPAATRPANEPGQ